MKVQVGAVWVPTEALVDLDAAMVDARPGDRFEVSATLFVEARGDHIDDVGAERLTSIAARVTRFSDIRKYAT